MKRTLRLRQIIKYDDYLGKHRATQMEPARALSYRSNSSSCYYMFLVVIVRPLKNGDFIPVRSERPQCSRPQKLKASPSRRTLHISIMECTLLSCEDHRVDHCPIANTTGLLKSARHIAIGPA
jgi:hypothetical protein